MHSESIDSVRTAADTKPLLGRRWGRPGAARFLVMCWYEPHGITTVYENIAIWQRLSEFELEILNLWPTRGHPLVLPPTIDLSEFDGVIIHAALSYSFENLNALDSQLGRPFEHYDGIKVLMKQDEQRATSLFAEYLGRKQFDVLLTCVPELELFRVYPRDKVGDLAFVNVLTGYVSQAMREMSNPWSRSRPIDIGYRGSIQPLCFGRLGFEKRKIGYDVLAALSGRDAIRSDISSRPQDRFNGSAWMDFISASKATLGVESGSNLFDFDGAVEEWCHGFEASHLEMNPLSEELYNLAHAEYLWKLEGNVDYAQVSPRHFEAGAARSLQVLYDGRYSDIFVPGAHFLPLARDLSNLPEIVETLNDERKCREITERCFAEIIHNPSYGYEAFVAKVDAALESALNRKRGARRLSTAPAGDPPRCLILTTADPAEDPRLGRITAALALEHEVYEIGTYGSGVDGGGPRLERLSERHLRLRVEPTRHESWWIPRPNTTGHALSLGLQKLLYLAVLIEASEPQLRSSIGALDALPDDVARFREQARLVLNFSSALFEAAQRTGQFDLVLVTDVGSLPAGVALREETGALLLINLGECFPDRAPGVRHWQSEFWASFNRELVAKADLAVTASSQSAPLLAAEYGREFEVLPSFEPVRQRIFEATPSQRRPEASGRIDLAWVDDHNAMRNRAPAESETARLLKSYAAEIVRLYEDHPVQAELQTARVLNSYAAEIIRLNEYFPAEIARLNEVYPAEISQFRAEINRLHEVYPAEIAKSQAEINRLHEVYKAEIGKLHTELDRLRQVIESYWGVKIYRLCKRGGASVLRTLNRAGSVES